MFELSAISGAFIWDSQQHLVIFLCDKTQVYRVLCTGTLVHRVFALFFSDVDAFCDVFNILY